MKQFIIDNAQWVFSGIGVAVIIGLARLALGLRKKGRDISSVHVSSQSISAGQGSTNVQTGDASTVLINHPASETRAHDDGPTNISDDGFVTLKTRIFEGDFQEFIWGAKTVRLSVSRIVKGNFYFSELRTEKEAFGVEIRFSTGGGLVYGGADCRKTDVNQYLMPQKEFQSEELCSVYSYYTEEKFFHFIRAYVDHVNQHSRQVTLDLVFVNILDIKKG